MVNPIFIIAIALGVAFLLPLFKKAGTSVVHTIFLLTLALLTYISGQWLYGFVFKGLQTIQIFTAGVKPPLSINLQMGLAEAMTLTGTNLLMLVGGFYMLRVLEKTGIRAFVLFLLLAVGMNGLIMTRDLFNVFVFLEITSIASYALIGMELSVNGLTAGFRYMVVGSLASMLLLLGIIFLYSISGTLNIDGMISSSAIQDGGLMTGIAVFMLILSFLIEMKQFPVNSWAFDVYQSAHPGVSALISAGSSGAILFVLAKILPIAGAAWFTIVAVVGLLTFVVSNLIGIQQKRTTRMLGYSSVGQIGLLLMVMGLGYQMDPGMGSFGFIIAALFFNHFFAKAGLYWLAGIFRKENIEDWSILRGKPIYQFLMGLFIFALMGFPPFAGFFGKWSLVMFLAQKQMFYWIGFLLLGSLLEAVYLLRWFGYAIRGEQTDEEKAETSLGQPSALWTFAFISLLSGWLAASQISTLSGLFYAPLVAALALFVLDWLPAKIKGFISIALIAVYAWLVAPGLSGWAWYFNMIFLGGGLVMTIATLVRSHRSAGFYPLLILMLGSLSGLVQATDLLQFFMAWELMTLSSYLLILRGKGAQKPALTYALFSLGGAYSILAGFAVAYSVSPGSFSLDILRQAGYLSPLVLALISVGFLVKVAAIGLHIWAPGAYTESEDDFTPMVAGILSKAGILGFVIVLARIGQPIVAGVSLTVVLGWIGALTAFFASLYAVFQEDAKKLLAWSSVGQVGYIVMGLAVMSHLGWAAAFWHTLNHLLFKGLLFLAVAGVIYRTGTRNMYEMGGLIKKMPLSFVSVLIGIIALSGVPPLTGFGGKWLLYEALIERGWYLQTGVAFFASTIAFLYCYRLIHAIFLGIPKPKYKEVKEAPLWLIVPQYILITLIMVFSVMPKLLLKPISAMIDPVFSTTLNWNNFTAISSLGYWNGSSVMIMVIVIFVLLTLYLFFFGPRPQKVKPFNIVYAAERPNRPETTHYAYNFFTPYRRAMEPLLKPLVKQFWYGVSEWVQTTAGMLRQIYTGNIQTNAMFILFFGLILFLFSVGVR